MATPPPEKRDPDLVAFGSRVRTLRNNAGLTQESLAAASGLHWTFIGQIERGTRNLSYRNVLRIAKGLGITASELVDVEQGQP